MGISPTTNKILHFSAKKRHVFPHETCHFQEASPNKASPPMVAPASWATLKSTATAVCVGLGGCIKVSPRLYMIIYIYILTGYILKNDLSWQSICAQINDVKWKIWTLKPPVNFYKWHQDWTRSTLKMNWSWKCPIKNFIQYSCHFISQQKNGCSSYHLVICYIAMENHHAINR